MTEDHRLSDADHSIEIRESTELLVLISTLHIELLDITKTLLCSLQTNNNRVWNHALGKLHHLITVRG